MVRPERAALLEVGPGRGPVLPLEVGAAQEPVRFGVGRIGQREPELVPRLVGPAGAEQGRRRTRWRGTIGEGTPSAWTVGRGRSSARLPVIGGAGRVVPLELDRTQKRLGSRLPARAGGQLLAGPGRVVQPVRREVRPRQLEERLGMPRVGVPARLPRLPGPTVLFPDRLRAQPQQVEVLGLESPADPSR